MKVIKLYLRNDKLTIHQLTLTDNILPKSVKKPKNGSLLVSSPVLDDFFQRTVIFITEHNENEGSVGFVLNSKLDIMLGQAVPELDGIESNLFLGGPVQKELLNFIHRVPEQIEGGMEISDGIFWGGNFDSLKSLSITQTLNMDDIIFFLGYSGWSPGQLDEELKQNTWYVTEAIQEDIFNNYTEEDLWRKVLRRMGGSYNTISSFPDDPIVN